MTIELLEDTIEATADYNETNQTTGDSTMPTSGCSLDCTPETVDVTISNVDINVDGGNVVIVVANAAPLDSTKKVISISVQDDDGTAIEDFFDIPLRIVDNPLTPGVFTVSGPDTLPGVSEFTLTTSPLGVVADFVVEHHGASDTWYLVSNLFGALKVSDAITVGV